MGNSGTFQVNGLLKVEMLSKEHLSGIYYPHKTRDYLGLQSCYKFSKVRGHFPSVK